MISAGRLGSLFKNWISEVSGQIRSLPQLLFKVGGVKRFKLRTEETIEHECQDKMINRRLKKIRKWKKGPKKGDEEER